MSFVLRANFMTVQVHYPAPLHTLLETAQPAAQTDTQSFIQERGRLIGRIDFIAYSQNAFLSINYQVYAIRCDRNIDNY
jgi:hypothetical protein